MKAIVWKFLPVSTLSRNSISGNGHPICLICYASSTTPWATLIKASATVLPKTNSVQQFKEDMSIFNARDAGQPRAAKTLRDVFGDDSEVKQRVQRMYEDNPYEKRTAAKICN